MNKMFKNSDLCTELSFSSANDDKDSVPQVVWKHRTNILNMVERKLKQNKNLRYLTPLTVKLIKSSYKEQSIIHETLEISALGDVMQFFGEEAKKAVRAYRAVKERDNVKEFEDTFKHLQDSLMTHQTIKEVFYTHYKRQMKFLRGGALV